MYLTETSERVRTIFEKLEEENDIFKLKVLIYMFNRLNTNHINSKNETNPDLVEDEDLKIFTLDLIGLDNDFNIIFVNNLIELLNSLKEEKEKIYVDNENIFGIRYSEQEKSLLSSFEKLSYNEKLDVIAEIFIRLDNGKLFSKDYDILSLNVNGYELASLIEKQKN